jgi:hypothetical protein
MENNVKKNEREGKNKSRQIVTSTGSAVGKAAG